MFCGIRRAAALSLGLTWVLGAQPAPAGGLNVQRDDLQRDVAFEHEPHRIITLLPSLTETVCALGACNRLVATDRYSEWPQQVRSLPKAGDLDDTEVELIVALKPDLVLLSRSQRITDRLAELGIPSFALQTDRYADIARTVTTIGAILGLVREAAGLNETIAAGVRQIGAQALGRRRGEGPTVYFEVDRAPYAAGAGSFIGELLARLGARNIVTPDLGAFPKLNPEYVVRNNPDVIFISRADAPGLAERPGWDQIRAIKERRICSFAPDINDTIVRPGPRVADGMRALDDCLARVSP